MAFFWFCVAMIFLIALVNVQRDFAHAKKEFEAKELHFTESLQSIRLLVTQYEKETSDEHEKELLELKVEKSTLKIENEQHISTIDTLRATVKDLNKIKAKYLKHEQIINDKEEQGRLAEKIRNATQRIKLMEQTYQDLKAGAVENFSDFYLPHHVILDQLAEGYDFSQASADYKRLKDEVKKMIKKDRAAACDYVDAAKQKAALDFVLDAFNGKAEAIASQVKTGNYGQLEKKLQRAFDMINKEGEPFRNARITPKYFELVKQQLKAAVVMHEIKKQDQEEQRKIKAQLRDEEKARRDYERALKEAEKEEKLALQTMARLEKEYLQSNEIERQKLQQEIDALKLEVDDLHQKTERAVSLAQLTKRGHVYIISNVGSFGEQVYKIGLTRRLDPMDRVKELGDASVPFSFDVHAIIYSEDAPELEASLHKAFDSCRVNKRNTRKEFFSTSIAEIRAKIEDLGYTEVNWTIAAKAQEYRESLAEEELAKAS